MKEKLAKLVAGISSDRTLREDLLQEAAVHLWLKETHRPNQTPSWYLQSCKFHLQHYLAQGCSVDAIKRRRNGAIVFETARTDANENAPDAECDSSFMASISAREILDLVSHKLQPLGRAVLECLADGKSGRDIARELKISHPTVIKHRRAIAALLLKMGVVPPVQHYGSTAMPIATVTPAISSPGGG